MKILQDYSLKQLNTFGVEASAHFLVEVDSLADLSELLESAVFKDNNKLFLGGGSNILLTKDFEGIVVLNKLKGIEVVEENDESVSIRAMSGEVWHDLVLFACQKGYWGIENLALIPGTVGAAPMQNIGAYGAEIKDTLLQVDTISVSDGEHKIFTKEECRLGYRDSVFKNNLKDKYFIVSITLKLSKLPNRNLNYKVLKEYIAEQNIDPQTPLAISEIVSDIRRSKLPDPRDLGNTGSFFKNIFVDAGFLDKLLKDYPQMPYFKEEEVFKIPTAWLIEQCGWKGKRVGSVGMHTKQALVLVNYGGASGGEIRDFAEDVIASVYEKFGIKLTPEVNFV